MRKQKAYLVLSLIRPGSSTHKALPVFLAALGAKQAGTVIVSMTPCIAYGCRCMSLRVVKVCLKYDKSLLLPSVKLTLIIWLSPRC